MFAKVIIVACLAVAAVNAEANANPGFLAAGVTPLAYSAGYAGAPLAYAGYPVAAYSAPLVAKHAAYAVAPAYAAAAAYAAPAYPYLRAAAAYPALY